VKAILVILSSHNKMCRDDVHYLLDIYIIYGTGFRCISSKLLGMSMEDSTLFIQLCTIWQGGRQNCDNLHTKCLQMTASECS
jgi:hypothetical protein